MGQLGRLSTIDPSTKPHATLAATPYGLVDGDMLIAFNKTEPVRRGTGSTSSKTSSTSSYSSLFTSTSRMGSGTTYSKPAYSREPKKEQGMQIGRHKNKSSGASRGNNSGGSGGGCGGSKSGGDAASDALVAKLATANDPWRDDVAPNALPLYFGKRDGGGESKAGNVAAIPIDPSGGVAAASAAVVKARRQRLVAMQEEEDADDGEDGDDAFMD